MKGRILVINTGSTSTKIGFYEDGQKSFEQNITLDKAVLAKYSSVMDLDLECRDAITEFLSSKSIPVDSIDIVMARGGLITPVVTGIYEVNKAMCDTLRTGRDGVHACNLSAIIANRGWYITPHIIKDSEDLAIDDKYRVKHYTDVEPKYFEKAVKGMSMAVSGTVQDGATATMARIPGVEVCGKTGTAENPHGADHSVFICFAPRENPQIAVAAYVENAGFGGTWACPISSLLVEKYLNGEIAESRKWVEKHVMDANLMNVQKKEKKQ